MSRPRCSLKLYLVACVVAMVATASTAQTITEIIDSTGAGAGNTLDTTFHIAVDGSGNAYVTGFNSDNAFKITPASPTSVEGSIVLFQ